MFFSVSQGAKAQTIASRSFKFILVVCIAANIVFQAQMLLFVYYIVNLNKAHPIRKNTRGFPGFYQPGRESEFGGCLPVVQYSTVQYSTCSLHYSRLHEKKTKKPGRRLLFLVCLNGTVFGFSYKNETAESPKKNGQFELRISLSCIRTVDT